MDPSRTTRYSLQPIVRNPSYAFVARLVLVLLVACGRSDGTGSRGDDSRIRIVFKHLAVPDSGHALDELIAEYERAHPNVDVVPELVPMNVEALHQFYLTSLDAGSTEIDVIEIDVIWVPEFARAGWIADLSSAFPPDRMRAEFAPAPAEVCTWGGRTHAVPWFIDVGVLFYRTDLVPVPPRTYAELRASALAVRARDPRNVGYTWQGRQYEGLICDAFEVMWGHGAVTMQRGRVVVDTPEARAGIAYMRQLIEDGVSPPSVTSAAEEQSRLVFHAGRAAFLRNWLYVWTEAQRPDSPIRGKVGIAPLPSLDGTPGPSTLGGWQLALNAHTPRYKRRAAIELIRYLTSHDANVRDALAYSMLPARRSAYADERIVRDAPHMAALADTVARARSRPVTPYYVMMADALQSELSAAVSGMRPASEALSRLQTLLDHIQDTER